MIQNLMLIDDDEDDREIFSSIVHDSFPAIRLTNASNGVEALQQLQLAGVIPNVIFLDLNMPLMSGRQFIEAVKADETLNSIPIVILTTSSDRKTVSEMKAIGANHFITKPDKFSAWEKMLNDFLTNPTL